VDRQSQRDIEWDCSQVLLRFYDAFDAWDYDAMVSLFTEDGVWHRAGKSLRGRREIVAEMRRRSATQIIRHVVTNILVDVNDAENAQARMYLTAYRHDAGEPRVVPAPLGPPALLLVVSTQLALRPEGWRIVEKRMQREFEAHS